MIRVIMVRLDGTPGDKFRLGACESLAKLFDAHVVGLFLNILPEPTLEDTGTTVEFWTRALDEARERGKMMQAEFTNRLRDMARSFECRRFDVYAHEQARITARECRTADVFVGLRLTDETLERRDVVEEVLFQSGRHLFLVADRKPFEHGFEHAVIAWNRSREAARAVTEALPYLLVSRQVTVVMIQQRGTPEFPPEQEEELVGYLDHHGIRASINIMNEGRFDTTSTLLQVVREQNADLVVLGGYGHSRLREWLLGGVTYKFLRQSPVPLVIAH
ncbi:universal stress protein [Rhizobium sp. P32RR-XVIII]|uniref:universal stress protein n=1 Tax=Rhizobium sp. P32RR-XVIII TaxID=2726738 RepID=UPI00145684C4|nr:universal stress protein [Rhizobium sp. P32RR-XVIII]NLS04909.1 universal stress protein [Rhizobium sp. P32RR-XVIII]